MRTIMYSGCHECIHVSRLRGAPIYYICNYTFKNVLPLSILLQKRWMRKPIFLVLGQFPEPAASPRTCTISAHRTISWFLEQIGNRITDSVSNSVPSSSCIRLQKQNRTINHWCLSTPYTKETLSTPIHSCSSRAISCWQTRQSVLGRWVDGCQCSWHSFSQSVRHMRRMHVLRSLGPAPADPPTFEADLRSCSVSRGKLQQQTANRHKDRLQALRK